MNPDCPVHRPLQEGARPFIGNPPVIQPRKVPFKCPVCYGSGTKLGSFYASVSDTAVSDHVSCRSCAGTGIVWGDG